MRKRRTITWEKIGECFICTSHKPNTHGYPGLWKNGRPHNMHRVLFEETFGPLPEGQIVRHKCDIRMCINLEHMEPGTPADNSNDMRVRGRCNTPRGETRADSKLTLKQVNEIASSSETQQTLAEKYGINQSTVSRIKNGLRWPERAI